MARRIPSFDELHLPPSSPRSPTAPGLVLVSTPIVRKLITENRDVELNEVIRSGDAGMLSFTQSLYRLFQQRLIDHETGRQAAPSIEEFEMSLRGIRQSQRAVL